MDLGNSNIYDFTEFHTCSFVALQMLNLFLMFTYTRWILKQATYSKKTNTVSCIPFGIAFIFSILRVYLEKLSLPPKIVNSSSSVAKHQNRHHILFLILHFLSLNITIHLYHKLYCSRLKLTF